MAYTPVPSGRTITPVATDRLIGGDGTVARTGDITIASILGLAPAPVDQTARDAAAAAQTTASAALPRTGGTMTGPIVLAADPAAALQPATKQYVDPIATTANGALQRAGGTMTGLLVLSADPAAALGAATKQYVDARVGTGGTTAPNARVVTAAGNVTVAAADGLIVIRKATGQATTVTLEPGPAANAVHRIKDGKGDAATNNITIVPAAGTIDGAANYVLAVNRGAVTVEYDGTEWVVT